MYLVVDDRHCTTKVGIVGREGSGKEVGSSIKWSQETAVRSHESSFSQHIISRDVRTLHYVNKFRVLQIRAARDLGFLGIWVAMFLFMKLVKHQPHQSLQKGNRSHVWDFTSTQETKESVALGCGCCCCAALWVSPAY